MAIGVHFDVVGMPPGKFAEVHERLEAFGAHLMPILAELEVNPGEPVVGEIELMVTPD